MFYWTTVLSEIVSFKGIFFPSPNPRKDFYLTLRPMEISGFIYILYRTFETS